MTEGFLTAGLWVKLLAHLGLWSLETKSCTPIFVRWMVTSATSRENAQGAGWTQWKRNNEQVAGFIPVLLMVEVDMSENLSFIKLFSGGIFEILIAGMTCEGCAKRVQKVIEKVPGVT